MPSQTTIPENPGGPIREPRSAASLLVVRGLNAGGGAGDHQILMARRCASHRFMPNVLVFPGGAVDPSDHHARVAKPLTPRVLARLQRSAGIGMAQPLAVAAARELQEEVGLSLGTPPALDALEFLCRAITPPDRGIRFDAFFFVVDAERVSGTPTGSVELEDPRWYTIEQALAGELAAATRAILGQFQRWLAHHDRDGPIPVMRDRRWSEE